MLDQREETLTLKIAWRNRARSEALPDQVWGYIHARQYWKVPL